MNQLNSCNWPSTDPLMIKYHDEEWGIPIHDDTKIFEFMLLDAFQAGLSWKTILHKRENFRKAFDNFDIRRIAEYNEKEIQRLLSDSTIIRNKAKINAAVTNACCFLKVQKEFGTFDRFIWQFTNGKTIHNKWKSLKEMPSFSRESDEMSVELKKRGFKFVGTTICYAFMQASGMVNDHLAHCYRYKELISVG